MIFNWKYGYVSWRPSSQWRHNEHDGVSNHLPHDCLLDRLFRCRSKKTSKLRVTGLCEGNSPVTGEFPAQMTSNAESVSIWWRHHDCVGYYPCALSHATTFAACLRIRVFLWFASVLSSNRLWCIKLWKGHKLVWYFSFYGESCGIVKYVTKI